MSEQSEGAPREAGPRIGSVVHTTLYVTDLQRSREFYQGVLGFPLASEPEPNMCALSISHDRVLQLRRKTDQPGAGTVPSAAGVPSVGERSRAATSTPATIFSMGRNCPMTPVEEMRTSC